MIEAPSRVHAADLLQDHPVGQLPRSFALLPVRVFLGIGWMRAGVEKLMSSEWWAGNEVRAFLIEQETRTLPPLAPIADGLLAPLATPISALMLALQLGVAVALLSGRHVRPALWAAVVMNLSFMALGSVNPSAFYLVMQLALLFGLALDADLRRRPDERIEAGQTAFTVAVVTAACVIPLAPFVTTLHPAHVIEDPAIVLITVALLATGCHGLRWTLLTAGSQRDLRLDRLRTIVSDRLSGSVDQSR